MVNIKVFVILANIHYGAKCDAFSLSFLQIATDNATVSLKVNRENETD